VLSFAAGHMLKQPVISKNLIITEEAAIAKGIRRIIAVTGTEAREASRVASSLEQELDLIDRKTGRHKDTAIKGFSVTLAAADISLLKKIQLKDRLSVMRKAYDSEIKVVEAAVIKKGGGGNGVILQRKAQRNPLCREHS